MNYTMIQEIWQHQRELREEKELRKVGAKNHCNQYLYLAFKGKQEKSPDGGKCLMSMTNHAAGIGTCTQKWHDNSELSLLGDRSEKIPDQAESQSWDVNFRAEVCAKNLALALQWIKEILAASSLKDLINPKSITGQNFPACEELDLMMVANLKRCYDKHPHFQRRIRVKEQRARKDNRFLRGSQFA